MARARPGSDHARGGDVPQPSDQQPTPAFSSVTLTDSGNQRIKTSKMRATDDTLSVIADIEQPLEPGTYQVVWRTAGDDGHAVRGKYSFTVKP